MWMNFHWDGKKQMVEELLCREPLLPAPGSRLQGQSGEQQANRAWR